MILVMGQFKKAMYKAFTDCCEPVDAEKSLTQLQEFACTCGAISDHNVRWSERGELVSRVIIILYILASGLAARSEK